MEVPRLGVESELQLPAYTTATAMGGPNLIFDVHRSSQQCWLLNPPSEASNPQLLVGFVSSVPPREFLISVPIYVSYGRNYQCILSGA